MKRTIFYFALIFLVLSCAKDDLTKTDFTDQAIQVETRGQKVDVCHNGHIIRVSINAVPAHQAHGDAVDMDGDGYFDKDNVCGPTDCDDTDPESNETCVLCEDCSDVLNEFLDGLDPSEFCYLLFSDPGVTNLYLYKTDIAGNRLVLNLKSNNFTIWPDGGSRIEGRISKDCFDCSLDYILENFKECE